MSYDEEKMAIGQAVLDLVEAVMGGNGAVAEEEPEEEAPPPKKRGRAAKAAPPAEEKPAAAPAKRGRGGKKPAGPTIAEVRDKLREVSDTLGRDEAKGMLEEFDVKKVTDLEESDFAEFIEMCDEALEEGGDD